LLNQSSQQLAGDWITHQMRANETFWFANAVGAIMTASEYALMILDPEFTPAGDSAEDGPGQCAEWHEHEHTVPSVQSQAEQLLETAGSPELAKHAIDVVANQQ
jgi:hypothetical protein